MIPLERVKELELWLLRQNWIRGSNPYIYDLLSILTEYADKIRAGGKPTAPQGETPVASVLSKTATHGGPITPSADASPGSIDDERALSILAGFITHVEVFHSHPNFDPETRKALSHLRRRLSERKRVTREWVRQLVLSYANSVRNGDMNGPESMLRSIGVEVSE